MNKEKLNRIVIILWTHENKIINSKYQDEYQVKGEDILRIAESIIDDIKGDTYEIIDDYILEYLEKNKFFDVGN